MKEKSIKHYVTTNHIEEKLKELLHLMEKYPDLLVSHPHDRR